MWYEILPPFFIVAASVGLPGYALWWAHKLVIGNHYRRTLIEDWDRRMYQRDLRVNGNPYILRGLETLPDPPKPKDYQPKAGKIPPKNVSNAK